MSSKAHRAEQRIKDKDQISTQNIDDLVNISREEERTVLIVEDNTEIRELLGTLLGIQHFRVVTAADGRTGLEAAMAESPDCVITDVNLPNLSGIDMVKILRRDYRFQSLPIIAITAYGNWAAAKAVEAGADLTMMKPLEPDELITAISRLMEARESDYSPASKKIN